MPSYNSIQPNITPLNANIAQQIARTEDRRSAAQRHYQKAHARRVKRIKVVGFALILLFLVQLLMAQVRLHAASKTLTASQQKLATAQKTRSGLQADLKRTKDPAYLQQILREKYGYTKEGELIYNLPENTRN
ncbi:septum formation initiator family protein [Leuconostocaceae bacterium ESL0723]|nr:septum formation initiator family protein [Leuconostocaceae bacterium ESL0723]